MRLTINLDESYYRAAKALSKAEDLSISAALNRMIAAGFERQARMHPTNDSEDGFESFPVSAGSKPLTSDLVAEIDQSP